MQRCWVLGILALALCPLGVFAGWAFNPTPEATITSPAALEATTMPSLASEANQPLSSAGSQVELIDAVVAREIVNQQPVGVSDQFTNDITKLYCYSDTLSGKKGDRLIHRWMRAGQTMAEIILPIKASPYRTWSSKNIQPGWLGQWSIEIEINGQVLKTLHFVVTQAEATIPAVAKKSGWAKLTVQVEQAVIATSVVNAEPQGAGDAFPAATGKLFCFTKISGAKPGEIIIHRWLYKGVAVDEIPLTIKRNPARTWSVKTIPLDFQGEWEVEIRCQQEVLKKVAFKINR